jgi:hypothetical protein
MGAATFDALHREGVACCLAGTSRRELPPTEGQPRWGLSCLLLPDPVLAGRLDALTRQAAALAGPLHWRSGASGFAHVTVRSLEPFRATVPDHDAALGRYDAALRRAAGRCGPVHLQLTGVILTAATVMACAEQVDGSADRLADALAEGSLRAGGRAGRGEDAPCRPAAGAPRRRQRHRLTGPPVTATTSSVVKAAHH